PNEVLTKESELFRWKKEELKEEKPALNVESSEFIESIETPGFSSIYSWDLAFGESATKHVDKSVISYNGSGVPMEICPFFQADSLNPGDKIELTLQYGGKNFTGHIIKEQIIPGVKSPRTRIFWDKDLGDIIREYFKEPCEDCIIKFYKVESYKKTYVLDFFIVDSSQLLDEVKKQDSLVKITKQYTRNPLLNIQFGEISARVKYYSEDNYYILLFASEISCVIVPPTKLGEPDKRILIREKKLISRSRDSRLLSVDESIRYSSLNEVLSSIFGIQCSAPYPNPLALPVKGMYRLPNLALVEDSTTTRQTKTTTPLVKVESVDEEPVGENAITFVGTKKGENIINVTSFTADTSVIIENVDETVSLVNEEELLSLNYHHLESKSNRSVFVLSKLDYSNKDQLLLTILAQTFPNGIDIKNQLQMRKFIDQYNNASSSKNMTQNTSNMSLISSEIMDIAIQCKGDIWISPESLNISDELLTKIITQIINYLNNGEVTVCFDIIYQQYESELISTKVYDSLTLENLVSRYLKKGYYYFCGYISKLKRDMWPKALGRKIILALQAYGEPIFYTQLCDDLPHIPIEAIDNCLKLPEVIGAGKLRYYVHINCLDITSDDINVLHDIIVTNMKNNIITTAYIYSLYQKNNPDFFERNQNMGKRSLADLAKYYFRDEFSYRPGYVSRGDIVFSAKDCVIQYLCTMSEFTYQDIESYLNDNHYNVVTCDVLWSILTKHRYLRLDVDRFVSSGILPIPQETLCAIGSLLNNELHNGYICSDNIPNYLSYPYIGTNPCTPYLLESIVRIYGNVMPIPLKVIDYYMGRRKPRGIIVTRDSCFQSYEEIICDVIKRRHETMPFKNVNRAIEYLKEYKYIEKVPAGIEDIYHKAICT
ncbi:MAG: hypothetical protein PHQ11_11085, partial [Paludibacter sp.]|nr:hypothetical protein [Paludibacter sp.]